MPVAVFRAEDLLLLDLQDSQRAEMTWSDWRGLGERYEAAGNAFTVRDAAGTVVFCGGAIERHAGYATLWGLFGRNRPGVPLQLTRQVQRFVAGLTHRRVDASVAADNAGACGWVQIIGLRLESTMRAAAADGGDLLIFARTLEGAL